MKRNILILGLVLAVVGIVLWLYAEDATSNWDVWYRTSFLYEYRKAPREDLDIPADMYIYLDLPLKRGTQVEYSFSANNTVNFLVMDGRNYERLKAEESFNIIDGLDNINSTQFMFVAPKTDNFYFVINQAGEYPLRVSVTYTVSYLSPPIAFGGLGLIGVGAVVALLGFRGWIFKPKIAIPPRLLDLVKTRGRIKIDQLAQELGTTEAHVETGVYELMRAGHPIRFEAETREVVYG